MSNNVNNKIVLGTAGLAGIWGPVDFEESEDTILFALESGINHFDTSPAYSNAEQILGNAISKWKGAKPFISTKAGKLKSNSPESVLYDFSPNALRRSVLESLETLRIEKIDVLFLHEPSAIKPYEIELAIDTLKRCKSDGLVEAIGIGGNYGPEFAPFAIKSNFDFYIGYNRYNIINQKATKTEFIQLMNESIKLWQASPLYMGLLGRMRETYLSNPPTWIELDDIKKTKDLVEFCEKMDVSVTTLAFQFILRSEMINKMVIGASNLTELNQSLLSFKSSSVYEPILSDYLAAYQNVVDK